jgi:hypothetical protein
MGGPGHHVHLLLPVDGDPVFGQHVLFRPVHP